MFRCNEREVPNKSHLHANQNMKVRDYYMKIDPPRWIAADFECLNVPVESNIDNITESGPRTSFTLRTSCL